MLPKCVKYFAVLMVVISGAAQGSVINESHVVAADTATAALVPEAKTLTIATAGDYTITLRDVGKEAHNDQFSSLSFVITQGDQLVKLVSVPEGSSASDLQTVSATATVTLNAGSYSLQVLGATTTAGLYSVNIVDASSASVWTDSAAITAAAAVDVSSLDLTLSVSSGQSYSVALTDFAFPDALAINMTVLVDGTPSSQCTLSGSGSCSFTAGASNRLLVVASSPGSTSGLYGIKITDSSNGVVLSNTYAVGDMPTPVSITLPSTASYAFTATDLLSPSALTSLKLALVQGGDLLTNQSVAGTSATASFSATAGTAKLYVVATANSTQGAGIYAVQIKQGSTAVYTNAKSVTAASTTTSAGFTFKFTAPSSGTYSVNLTDFNFPQTLTTLSVAATQNGAVLGTRSTAGTLSVTAQAGEVQLVVLATPGTAAQGLFGVSVTASGASTNLFEATQGVGGMFTTIPVTLSTIGSYKLNVTDFAAPQALSQLYVVVTRGSQSFGTIYGGTTTASTTFDVTSAGDYTLNIIANTKSTSAFGMYGVSLSAAPVITFTTDKSSVSAGASVTLTWSATDATACTASGGWTGTKATSATQSFGPVNADVALTLTCTGVGGSTAKTINVSVAATGSSSHHGGGAFSWMMLLGLASLGGWRAYSKRTAH